MNNLDNNDQDNRLIAEIKPFGGVPTMFINGIPRDVHAYMSYFDERACYRAFSDAGVNLFSVPVYFAGRGINSDTGIGPFRQGLWDNPEGLCFEPLDQDMERLLKAVPEAYVFPRIHMDMPHWWDERYPEELNALLDGDTRRQSFSSLRWLNDAGWALQETVSYLRQKYGAHLIGIHICAGGTEEWAYHGWPHADFGQPASQAFRERMRSQGAAETMELPDGVLELARRSERNEGEVFLDPSSEELLMHYRRFLSEAAGDAIVHFSRLVKRQVNNELLVGVFYGYALEITDARAGHHNMAKLLHEEAIDFFCSPNSYLGVRQPGMDWPYMSAAHSIWLHGKMLWTECDTRTCLTKPLKEARPDICPPGKYEGGVWKGPESMAVTKSLLLKNFGKCLAEGSGMWWFDMWGGWYDHPEIMQLMTRFSSVGNGALTLDSRASTAEVAVIVDERSFAWMRPESAVTYAWTYRQRLGLGSMGAPYHIYDVSNLSQLQNRPYKLYMMLNVAVYSSELDRLAEGIRERGGSICWTYAPGIVSGTTLDISTIRKLTGFKAIKLQSEKLKLVVEVDGESVSYGVEEYVSPILAISDESATALGKLAGTDYCGLAMKRIGKSLSYYSVAPDLPSSVLRTVAARARVHLYTDTEDVVYANAHFLCVHAASAGVKMITLPAPRIVRDAMTGEYMMDGRRCASFSIHMAQFETILFQLLTHM
ncbi:hypothetical protein [Paenibacillus chungangensis]|uniref:Glycoside hydrolase family 42 N-terminal domain-containing protein n=1 Tax=Paenibacillus chungangensis TaxID=696535 RepID=A0ABW3HLA7_9BACL